jgi:hypothetical protein
MDGDRPSGERRDGERGAVTLDVALGPVDGGGAGRRRAGAVLSASVAIVAVAIVLAALPATLEPSSNGNPGQQAVLPSISGSPSPMASFSSGSPQATSSRREVLPALANEAFAGAPNPVLVERQGDEARLHAWNTGDQLRVVRTFPGAFTGESQFAFVSPDAQSIVVASFGGGADGADSARLLTGDGGVAWESGGITTIRGVVWSSDSRKLVVGAASGAWIVVTIGARGTAEEQRIVITDARLAPTITSSVPSPPPSGDSSSLVPVAFSADGRWIYGAPVSGTSGSLRPTVRVSIPKGTVEAISRAPTSGPDRIGPGDGRGGLDPVTGRAIRWGLNASIPGGPPTVEVTEGDGSLAYRVEVGVVLGATWESDGELLILAADGYPFPTQLRLLQIAPDGAVGPTLLSTGSVAWGELIGVRDGFAVLALATRQPDDMTQLVVVNLADKKATGVTLPADHGGILGAGLLP